MAMNIKRGDKLRTKHHGVVEARGEPREISGGSVVDVVGRPAFCGSPLSWCEPVCNVVENVTTGEVLP